ncbi:HlyD family efflux transporter periplasmic adaptor subunit [Lentibacter algarum]|uniref:efflux RND transporter periplasmic adaptor subunit n=1 Tax=Lentibacter algarum TaxID=576131 RepID=UPI001C07B87F|nr:HlyD family efflux transporter periplasmic adaptor subunit [Lentibacter algarum]MBU2981884.1 HlyD family efflux transporter periplasmic adaptor subunit [Lentibacter algarum]
MRFFRRGLTGLSILALTLGLLGFSVLLLRGAFAERAAQSARAPRIQERVFAVNAQRLVAGELTPVLTAYGEIKSLRTLEIRPAVGGMITQMSANFVDGGSFSQGDLMLKIDDADAQAAFERAEADVMDAEAEVRDALRALELARDEQVNAQEQADLRQRAFVRQQDLRKRGVGTDTAVETAELAASTAKAAVLTRRQALAQAEARVDSSATRRARAAIALSDAKRSLSETEVRARFDGVIAEVNAVEGRLVNSNERLAELVDPNQLEVAFRVSTQAYSQLLDAEGNLKTAEVRAVLDDFGVDLSSTGTLSREGAANSSGQTGRALFARLQEARGLKPGDFVTVLLEEAPMQNVLRLPATGLAADSTVLKINDDNRLELVSVELLRRQGDDVIIFAPELDGALVVSKRTPLLGAGISVKPVVAGAAAEPEAPAMIELSQERRDRLVSAIKASQRMPEDVKKRILARLSEDQVPAKMVERIESRMGG